jgi:peptidoglycan/LPS O-acetylase OafA/YrhL
MERKHFLDNIRWVTVLLVLLYHVIYFYNNKGVFGGVGGFGDGLLWFIQDLWLFSLLLLLVRKLDGKDRFHAWCGKVFGGKYGIVWILLLGLLFWLGEHTLIMNPRPESADGLYNLYKPLFYFIPFLLGYFVFSDDKVQDRLAKAWIPLLAIAVISGTILVITTFGENNTTPQYMGSPLNCIYGWLMCLAMMGWFKACFDRTNRFASYMTRSSFGLYIVHYLVVACFGYMMKVHTQLLANRHVSDSNRCRFHTFAAVVRDHQAHSFCALVCAWREKTASSIIDRRLLPNVLPFFGGLIQV